MLIACTDLGATISLRLSREECGIRNALRYQRCERFIFDHCTILQNDDVVGHFNDEIADPEGDEWNECAKPLQYNYGGGVAPMGLPHELVSDGA